MKRTFITAMAAMMLCIPVMAIDTAGTEAAAEQKESKKKKEVKYNEKGEIIKTGTNFGPLPVVAFDADRGFQFGALLNLYNFGDGKNYPNPNSQWYFEASAYTKESAINSYKFIVNYDNKTLIPGVRMSICTGYYKDAALDFYGFNGYQSNYITSKQMFEDGWSSYLPDEAGAKLEAKGKYPKGFYRFGRDLVKAKIDFTGKILENFYWEAGYNFSWVGAKSFVPKGYEVLGGTSLFDLYKIWGIIPEDEADGGLTSSIRVGLMYDSRNVENNPTKGIWAEAHVIAAPEWLGTTHGHYKYCATFRQYVPIVKDGKLTFAYRIAYQGTFGKDSPWYSMPFYTNMGIKADNDGFGGYRTVRGLMLNRVQGLDVGFFNAELRWKFIDFKLWKQNIAFALSGFCDGAHVFRGYDMNFTDAAKQKIVESAADPLAGAVELMKYEDLYKTFVINRKDGFHGSAGAGLRFIMNQNFIVAFEYARCFNKQDGNGAFYINTGFLF
ncbi:MAG: BamA/TamA family outer membrane protein [Bacteroidales bacterium]|nr:BamA/TamA family outer membrane protein [Bacteroidales bacterium]MBQ8500487.1 BamA/TamA family outer membrane protein [Bacteroidales bacterium]